MSTVILTFVIIAIVSASAAGVMLLSSRTSTSSGNGFQVVKNNVTVYGLPAIMGRCSAIAASCPYQSNPSLVVELISYKGTYYYSYSGQIVNGGTITMTQTNSAGGITVTTTTQSQTTTTYTAWFTNSTLYCVTPEMPTAPIACPS